MLAGLLERWKLASSQFACNTGCDISNNLSKTGNNRCIERNAPIPVVTRCVTTFFLLFYCYGAAAQNSLESYIELHKKLNDCALINVSARRLACFDALIGEDRQHAADSTKVTPLPVEVAAGDGEESEGGEAVASSEALVNGSVLADDKAQAALGTKYLPSNVDEKKNKPKKTYFEFVLLKASQDRKKRWVFTFDNGQVWRQIEARYLPRPKDLPAKATIAKGVLGSHDLKVSYSRKTIKVKRIE